jgi:hypothetical protein
MGREAVADGLPAAKSAKAKVIQSETEGNTEKPPGYRGRYDGRNRAKKQDDGRDYVQEHPNGHV